MELHTSYETDSLAKKTIIVFNQRQFISVVVIKVERLVGSATANKGMIDIPNVTYYIKLQS